MSWFLFKSRKKAGRKAVKQPKTKKWDPGSLFRVLQAATAIVLLAAVAAGWALGQAPLEKLVAAAHKSNPQVRLVDAPAWMPEQIVRELREAVADQLTEDPFDRGSLNAAAKELAASPWVQRVVRITRRPDGLVEVALEYRQRTALVHTASGYHLIDRQRVRLPYCYSRQEATQMGLPIIGGVAGAMPEPGRAWTGDDLAAGLKLAACIAGQSWSGQVKAIDVSNFGGRRDPRRGQLKLLAALDDDDDPSNNPGVEWGRPPGQEQPYEPDASWKLRRITAEVRRNGRLDDRIVKVTQEPGLTRRLVSEDLVSATDSRPSPEP